MLFKSYLFPYNSIFTCKYWHATVTEQINIAYGAVLKLITLEHDGAGNVKCNICWFINSLWTETKMGTSENNNL